MTSIDRERLKALARKAKALREELREREKRRAGQIAANAEARRGWIKSDTTEARQGH
jgi:hypothetical protein